MQKMIPKLIWMKSPDPYPAQLQTAPIVLLKLLAETICVWKKVYPSTLSILLQQILYLTTHSLLCTRSLQSSVIHHTGPGEIHRVTQSTVKTWVYMIVIVSSWSPQSKLKTFVFLWSCWRLTPFWRQSWYLSRNYFIQRLVCVSEEVGQCHKSCYKLQNVEGGA